MPSFSATSPHRRLRPSTPRSTVDPLERYICGMIEEGEAPDDPEEIMSDEALIGMLHKIAEAVSTHLRDGEAEVVAEHACLMPCIDDSLPVIGEIPGVEGYFISTEHNCWGILNGPTTGVSLAELILTDRSTADLAPFISSRFTRKGARLQK